MCFYGLFRSFVEFFREPHAGHPLDIGVLTPGIVYSIPMILLGLWLIRRAQMKPAHRAMMRALAREAADDLSLAARLHARIAKNGPLSVEAFMQACLSDAASGAYTSRQPIGGAGDFITAPEISQIFGELIGLWAVAVWQSMGEPRAVTVAELGPGRGTLMADALRAWRGSAEIPRRRLCRAHRDKPRHGCGTAKHSSRGSGAGSLVRDAG